MTTTQTLTAVKSSELRPGNRVHVHGMIVELADNCRAYDDRKYGPVFAYRGTVVNMDAIRTNDPWLYNFVRADRRDGENGNNWTIQGNDYASWLIEG